MYNESYCSGGQGEVCLYLSVKELEQGKVLFDVAFPPGAIQFDEEHVRQSTPMQAEGSAELLASSIGEIRICGRVRVEMEAECDRCLETCRFPIDSAFDLCYRPAEMSAAEEEVSLDAGESEVGFYEGAGLELGDILREHILLSLPMQLICRDDCRGICPVCGQDRNQVVCGCQGRALDDRWSALRDLKLRAN